MRRDATRWNSPLLRNTLCAVFLLAVLAVLHGDLVLGTRHIPYDYDTYHWPLFREVADRIAAGHATGWDTSEYGGTPLLTNVNAAVFYPPHLLALGVVWLTGMHVTLRQFELLEVSHWALLAVTTMIYFRSHKIDRIWAATSTALLLASGALLSQGEHLGIIEMLAWLPLAMLAVEKVVEAPTRRRTACLGLVLAVMLSAGFLPQFAACILFLAAWTVTLIVQKRENPLRVLLCLAAGLGLAGASAAIIVLPLIHDRSFFPVVDAPPAFPTHVLKSAFAPNVFGQLDNNPGTYVEQTDITWSYYYFGAFVLLAAPIAFLTRHRLARPAQVTTLVLLLAGFGSPGQHILTALRSTPAVGSLYRASPVPALLCFSIVVLVAHALQRATWPRSSLGISVAGTAVVLAFTHTHTSTPTQISWEAVPTTSIVVFLAAAAALASRNQRLIMLLVVAGVAELVAVNGNLFWFSSPGSPSRWDPQHVSGNYDAALAYLQADPGLFRVAVDQSTMTDTWDNGWRVWGLDSISGFDPQFSAAWTTLAEDGAGTYAQPRRFTESKLDSGILQILDVRYLVWRTGTVPRLPSDIKLVFKDDMYSIAKVEDERPRVYGSTPACLTRAAVSTQRSACAHVDTAISAQQDADKLTVTLAAGHPAETIVTGTASFPGWHASVDGHDHRIGTALGAIQSVAVQPGDHEIVLTYHPSWFQAGRAISVLALLAAALLALGRPIGRQRKRVAGPQAET